MALGTWRSPFPFQLGGQSVARVSRLYDGLRSNIGDALNTEQGTIAGGEIVAEARMLSLADRAIDRRVKQLQDPRKLTDPRLARLEAFLGITRSVNDTDQIRRLRVASRILVGYGAGSGELSRLASEAFAPWTATVHYHDAATALSAWPGNGLTTSWTSSVALITVEYVRPTSASDADCKARVDACSAALDEHLPAWCTFCCSETYEGDTFGFMIGKSRFGHAALT